MSPGFSIEGTYAAGKPCEVCPVVGLDELIVKINVSTLQRNPTDPTGLI